MYRKGDTERQGLLETGTQRHTYRIKNIQRRENIETGTQRGRHTTGAHRDGVA